MKEAKKNFKRQVMDTLTKKAIEARDKGVEKVKKEMESSPKILGANRATVRKYIKQQSKILRQQRKREIAKLRRDEDKKFNDHIDRCIAANEAVENEKTEN
jgi:hypothetical protein